MQSDYFESDNFEVAPDQYNDQIENKNVATIPQQIAFLQEQTNLLKQSLQLEQELQVNDPLGYLNALENKLESMKITNLQQRISCLAILGSGAEKQVILKCSLPSSDNIQQFQQLEKQVYALETLIGTKPYGYNATIMDDLNEISKLISTIQGDVKLGYTQTIPQVDKINEMFRQLQLLLGISDLLPLIVTRLEELKKAHDQSIQYQNQLKELLEKHTKIQNLMQANRIKIKELSKKILSKLQ